jgi:hypothetical protein
MEEIEKMETMWKGLNVREDFANGNDGATNERSEGETIAIPTIQETEDAEMCF